MAINRLRQPEDALLSKWGFLKPRRPALNKLHPINQGLVGCWLLGDAAAGVIYDISESGNSGSVGNTPLTTQPSHHRGFASHFDITGGNDEYIVIPNSDSINLITVTMSCWCYYDGSGSFPRIISKLSGGPFNGYELLAYDGTSFPAFQIGKGGGVTLAHDSVILPRNIWNHVVGTYDGFTGRLYINGAQVGTFSSTNALGTTTTALNIGRWPGATSSYFSGGIEGVRLYNRGLSADEVLRLYVEPYAGIYDAVASRNVTGIEAPVIDNSYSYAEIWRRHPIGSASVSASVTMPSAPASTAVSPFTIASHNATLTLQSATAAASASAVSSITGNASKTLVSVSAGTSAASIPFSGSSTTVTTLIVCNDSGGTAAAGSITQTFGHKFKEGDIKSGTYPDFRLQDSTVNPYSMSLAARSLYSPTDGSLWDATFMLRMPNAIPASFTATVTTTNGSTTATMASTASLAQYMGIFGANISIRPTGVASITNGTTFLLTRAAVKTGSFTATFNGVLVSVKTNGAGPGSNSRSTADFPAIKNTAIYQNGGTGTAVCALSYAIANPRADDYQFMGGAVGSCWVYPTTPYTVSGTPDPLLNAHIAAYSLENASGGLYGTRELILPSNGFGDVAGNTWKSFSSVITDDGLGHTFNCYDPSTIGSARNCTAATVGNNLFPYTGNAFDGGELVQVGGPSPPSPLVIGNYYWLQKVSASTFQLSNGSAQGTARIVPTTTGGTWTVTAYPWLVPFGTQSDAGPQARPRFYQGAGTVAADVALRVYKDPYYMRSTGFYPSFDCEGADYQHSGTRPAPSTKTSTYFWGTSQPLGQRSLGGVSPEPTGYDLWSSNDFFNQSVTTQRNSAMSALIGTQFGIRIRSGQSATRGRIIPVNNNNYTGSGMPTSRPTMSYSGGSGGTTFPASAAPTPTNILLPGFDAQTFDHWFAWFTGPADAFREPHHIDWMIDDAAHAMFERTATGVPGVNHYSATQWSPGGTKYVSNSGYGTNRYCLNIGGSLQNGRYDAWANRTFMHAATRICTGWAEYQYLHDAADDTTANLVEVIANQSTNPVAAATGFWLKGPTNFFFDGWQIAYYGMGMGPAGNYSKFNANALVGMNQTLKHMTNIASIMGFPLGYAQETPITATSGATTGPLIADSSLMAGESFTISWNNTSVFTWMNFSTTTLHTQGTYDFTKSTVGSADYFIFTSHTPPSESIRMPGGGTEMMKYYVKPLSASTCELHRLADFSDAPFVPSDTNSSVTWFRIVDFSTKLVFPAAYNIKDQFYNTMWDAVATAIAWGQTGGDATGQATWTTSWQAALTAGLLNQTVQGDGPNYLNTTL